jgi:hypothetical protein
MLRAFLTLFMALFALTQLLPTSSMADEILSVTSYLSYRTCDRKTSGETSCVGRSATTYYRLQFAEADAQVVYEFFRDDVAKNLDNTEIVNKLIREALHAEDFPSELTLEGFTIKLAENPSEGTDFPVGEDEIVYLKVRVRLKDGGRSFDWIRRGSVPLVRLLNNGTILAQDLGQDMVVSS